MRPRASPDVQCTALVTGNWQSRHVGESGAFSGLIGAGTGDRRIDDADALVHPEHLVRPRRQRRCFRRARPVVEVKIHEIKIPLQLTERLENPRIVEPVHFHRELRNRREQFVWRCEKRFPFSAFDVHLDEHTPAGITVFADLIFQRVEEARFPVARPISDAFVVKDKSAAVADWPRWIETIVFVHRNVISARHLACPVVVWANTVRVSCIERFNQILAHQVTAIIGAAKALERTVFQSNWLKLRENRLTQLALRRAMDDRASNDGSGCRKGNHDEGDPNPRSFHERILHGSRRIQIIFHASELHRERTLQTVVRNRLQRRIVDEYRKRGGYLCTPAPA